MNNATNKSNINNLSFGSSNNTKNIES